MDPRSHLNGAPNPTYAVPNSACQMQVFSRHAGKSLLRYYGFVMRDPYLGTGFCKSFPVMPERIRKSRKPEIMVVQDPTSSGNPDRGIQIQPELCETLCFPNAGITEVHTRLACTKLCVFKGLDEASELSAMCYVHKLMQCACQDADASSGPKHAPCRSWKCEVQKTAKPEGANGSVLCRDKVMSA